MAKRKETKEESLIVVGKAEDWPAAKDVKIPLYLPDGDGTLKFEVRLLSLGEDQKLQNDHPFPEPPRVKRGSYEVEDREDAGYKDESAAVSFRRSVAVIDTCWHEIPGKTFDDKVNFAQEKLWRGGMFRDLYNLILQASGYSNGKRMADEDRKADGGITIATPADLAKHTQANVRYRFSMIEREIEFVVHGMSNMEIKAIEVDTDPGPPPLESAKTVAGGRASGVPQRNPKDPAYVVVKNGKALERNLRILEKALGFEFPGETFADRLSWLKDRPSGQVDSLLSFVKIELMSYRDITDFFTAA